MTYKESNVEVVVVHVQVLCEPLDSSVTDVDAVEEGEHVDDEEDWVDVQVNLAQQVSLSNSVYYNADCGDVAGR